MTKITWFYGVGVRIVDGKHVLDEYVRSATTGKLELIGIEMQGVDTPIIHCSKAQP